MRNNSFGSFIKSQKRFFLEFFKRSPKSFLLFFVLTALLACIAPLTIILNKNIINVISELSQNPDTYKNAVFLIMLVFTIQVLAGILSGLKGYNFTYLSNKVNYVLKEKLISKTISIPMEEYEDSEFYRKMNLANTAISMNGIKVIESTVSVLGNILSLVGVIGILISIHWAMPLGLFLSTIPGITLLFIAKFKRLKVARQTSLEELELGFTNKLFGDKSALKEIKLFSLGNYLIQKWAKLFLKIQNKNIKLAWWEFKSTSLAGIVLQVSNVIVSLILVNQILSNSITIGDYVALLTAVTTVQGIFASVGGNLSSIFETAIFNTALLEILDYEVKHEGSSTVLNSIDEISLKNVSFRYPKTDINVLENINLNIKKGESISIVGHNGSGKTTLVNCILGLYKPNNGEIKVNNINIDKLDMQGYFQKISAIFQDFVKYKYSVRENVMFGDISKPKDDTEIYEILRKVELDEKIKMYEQELDTYLTKEFIDGSELSGGEWQRVALTRAFIKNADLTIFDEPTAALDPIAELKIFEIFRKLASENSNKINITISHRLGPTRYSDRIIVMDKGRIVEEGSYSELMKLKGIYYEMYSSQSAWYSEEKEYEILKG